MSLNFIIDLKLWEIKELYVDVILATKIKSNCDKKFFITQSYSTSFIEKLTVKFNHNLIFFVILTFLIYIYRQFKDREIQVTPNLLIYL